MLEYPRMQRYFAGMKQSENPSAADNQQEIPLPYSPTPYRPVDDTEAWVASLVLRCSKGVQRSSETTRDGTEN